jgi:hypothetical protein
MPFYLMRCSQWATGRSGGRIINLGKVKAVFSTVKVPVATTVKIIGKFTVERPSPDEVGGVKIEPLPGALPP